MTNPIFESRNIDQSDGLMVQFKPRENIPRFFSSDCRNVIISLACGSPDVLAASNYEIKRLSSSKKKKIPLASLGLTCVDPGIIISIADE